MLHSGNRLILGKNHVFSFINPFEVRKTREAQTARAASKTRRSRPRKSVEHATLDESSTDAPDLSEATELVHEEDDISLLSNEEDDLLSIHDDEPEPLAVRVTSDTTPALMRAAGCSPTRCSAC